MAVLEMSQCHRKETELAAGLAELTELARGLAGLAAAAADFRSALPQVERGFRELSELARASSQTRVYQVSRAFAAILSKAERGPEEDLRFILDTAASFLDSLYVKYAWIGERGRTEVRGRA